MSTDSANTALLVMDFQAPMIGRIPDGEAFLARARTAIASAHQRGIPVIFVVVGFRAGRPEINPRNKSFGSISSEMLEALVDPAPVIAPEGDDVVVTKRRISAFIGSDLDVVLRARDIRHLVLCGIATSGVVLSTLRQAADQDYQLTVLSDLCFDADAEVHGVLMNKVFPRQASVMTAAEWGRD